MPAYSVTSAATAASAGLSLFWRSIPNCHLQGVPAQAGEVSIAISAMRPGEPAAIMRLERRIAYADLHRIAARAWITRLGDMSLPRRGYDWDATRISSLACHAPWPSESVASLRLRVVRVRRSVGSAFQRMGRR